MNYPLKPTAYVGTVPETLTSSRASSSPSESLRSRAHVETTDGRILLLHDPMDGMESCYRLVINVLNGKFDFNLLTAHRRDRERHGNRLLKMLRLLRRCSALYTPGYHYHPAILFLFEQYRVHLIAQCADASQVDWGLGDGRTVVDVAQDFVRVLKTRAIEERLRRRIRNHESKLDKNLERLKFWEEELFRRYSRPVIIRLDLEYRASLVDAETFIDTSAEHPFDRLDYNEIFKSGEALEGHALPAMRVGFNEVQADREKLFENMKGKPSLFGHLVGYVWRIEHTLKAGYHLHLVLAFDGAHVRKHEWLAQQIGEYWRDEITPGRGRFQNVNMNWAKKKTSPRYGIGVINWHEDALRASLREHVLPYLAKRGQYVLALPYKGCKLMGSGFVHREKEEARGRPRSLH